MRIPASVAILLSLFLFPALHPCPSHAGPEEADRLYSLGRERTTAGEYLQAEQAFAQAIVEDPQHQEARLQLASLLSRNILTYGKAEEILVSMPKTAGRTGAKGRDDLLFRAGVSLGSLYVKSGRSTEAGTLLRNVLASAPPGASLDEAYTTLGLAHYYERLYDDAIFEMRKAIKINPNNADAKFNLKTIRSRLEHFQAGKLFSRLGDRPRAVAEYRKAIDLDPRFIEARHRLGVELYLAGNSQEALKELRRASMVTSDYRKAYEIHYAEGLALLNLDRTVDAMGRFEQTVKARPTFAPAHNEMGKILLAREQYDPAIDHFVKAIGSDPKAEYARGLQIAMSRKAKTQAAEAPK
ncbi:MAG: tetratricopeptide repeat protein [bacterium]|nr:tetratricopeptide repeat protein [bacterium]